MFFVDKSNLRRCFDRRNVVERHLEELPFLNLPVEMFKSQKSLEIRQKTSWMEEIFEQTDEVLHVIYIKV